MLEPSAGILLLAVFLLPPASAILGRIASRRLGPGVVAPITFLGAAGSLGLALLLLLGGVELSSASGWTRLLPGNGPALQPLMFGIERDDQQTEGAAAVAAVPLLVPEPVAGGEALPATDPTRAVPTVVVPEPEASPTAPLPTPLPAIEEPVAGIPELYVVQAGDTLRSIAERLGVAVEALLAANSLSVDDGDRLTVGQELRVPSKLAAGGAELMPVPTPPEPTATEPPVPTPIPPTPTQAPPPAPPAPPPPTVQRQPPSPEIRAYIVKQGDTLRSIAEQFGVSSATLVRFNGLSAAEADSLRVGLRLYIPATAPRPTPEVLAYIVKQGDSLRSIAEQFGVSVDTLLRFNGLTPAEADLLRPGQRLYIPAR